MPVQIKPISTPESSKLKLSYVEALGRIERLHRRVLDLIRNEFDRMSWDDITPVQALLMFNIGGDELSPGELRSRGYYLGSNVSYNLKCLIEGQYIAQERSRADRRSTRIHLTPKGQEVAEVVSELYDRHLQSLEKVGELGDTTLHAVNDSLARLERFWTYEMQDRR
jgi:DNA-binding MarR family transcriptional regulator